MSTTADDFRGKARRILRKVMWGFIGAIFAGSLFYYIYRTWTISEGSRNGKLLKISKDGVIFKTYEGQMDVGSSQILSQHSIWSFSVKNVDVYHQMQQYEGRPVVLYYRQLVDPFPWQAKTQYIVYRIEGMVK